LKRVLTYGTFDILHYGHLDYLRRAKEMGDYLIVGVSSDEFNENKKNKRAFYPYEVRKEMVQSIKYVDETFEQSSFEQKKDDILKYNIDVLVSFSDWQGKYDYLKEYCEVVYLDKTPKTLPYSSTKIREYLNKDPEMREKYDINH